MLFDKLPLDAFGMPHSIALTLPWDETFCVGVDTGTPVDDKDYQVPFRFTGKNIKVTVKLGPVEMAPAKQGNEK